MERTVYTLGACRCELLHDGEQFLGLGAIWIGETQVRSGRLPLRPYTQTFTGLELAGLRLLGVETAVDELRIRLEAQFRPLPVKLMRDHSFDPIHETGDWDAPAAPRLGQLDLVLQPAADTFAGTAFHGFSYHYAYESRDVPLFYLLDQASWELDGDIAGATAIAQCSSSAPVVTFGPATAWTTEGVIHWVDEAAMANRCMTHNLPRWASHQAFDFQYKDGQTLLGVFARVDLIRTLLKREAGKAELKTFDKYIFDQALSYATPTKAILLNREPKSDTAQKNLWTRVFDEIHARARAEFDLREEPLIPFIHNNHWDDFHISGYSQDLLPVASALGFKAVFIDNVNKSAMSERCPHPDFHWNMCCGHEYEPAPRLGGPEALTAFMEDCTRRGITPFSWTNNDQALSSPVNRHERGHQGNWFVLLEDTRQKYGGAYMGCMSVLNFRKDGPRQYWVNCLKQTRAHTGLGGYLFDSFYNLGFMPVDYEDGIPTTQWRELLQAFKELQDADVHFLIESFGPFGLPMHGCPREYAMPDNLFATYKIYAQIGYTTIPTGTAEVVDDAEIVYRFFAHMASPLFTLYQDGQRLDELWTEKHIRALADYTSNYPNMHTRILQEDGQSVLWHDEARTQATLWNFVSREVALPGTVTDATTGTILPPAASYRLEACHTYTLTGAPLPVSITAVEAPVA